MSSTGIAAGRARAAEQSGMNTMPDADDDVDDVDDVDVPLAANAENRALHLEVCHVSFPPTYSFGSEVLCLTDGWCEAICTIHSCWGRSRSC